jgi:ATP-dependent DNA helicase DinG
MSDAASVQDLLGQGGVVARRLDGYEERPQQMELARGIEAALAAGEHLVAEAGTGVGKSFAYLVPAVLHALRHRGAGPVVVATRTIALQQQLERKDVPFLQAVLPHEFSAVTALGRSNYVCLRRLDLAGREQRSLFQAAELEDDLQLVRDWSLTTRDGIRLDLPRPVRQEVWEEVQAERGNCLHKACPHFEPCHYQRGRRRMGSTQILIVNHALYMADLALRMAGARYLPPHRVVIFDEAHHLERIATEHLGLKVSPTSLRWHLRRLHARNADHSLLRRYGTDRARFLVQQVEGASEQFFGACEARLGTAAMLPIEQEAIEDVMAEPLLALGNELSGCAAAIQDVSMRTELLARAQGFTAMRAAFAALCRGGDASMVRWLERGRFGAELHSAPLEVAPVLREHLFSQLGSAVLVSATLGPGDDREFTWLRRRLGLDAARTLRLGSPFDYRRQVELVVESDLPDPVRDSAGFNQASCARTVDYVIDNGGRALVLCTSWSFVKQVATALRRALAGTDIELLVQGEMATAQLLHLKATKPTSVLVGTDSLWEGIDIRGDALTLVIVTRLPFAQPDHPLVKARHRSIAARGGDAFAEDSLPEAILKFRQGFGRLVRSATDTGRVVVLDPRATTRGYGRRFLGALPFDAE